MAHKSVQTTAKNVLAKLADGTVQLTFTISKVAIAEAKKQTLEELREDTEIPGFRKGKAPLEKVAAKVPEASVIEHALSHILPHLLSEAIKEHKLTLAVYPKFELVSAKEGEDWQVRALTCEVPTFELEDYKKVISGEIASRQVGSTKDLTPEEKEQSVIKALLTGIKLEIPKLLIEEEVNSRLSNLLGRVEKLGLNLENYLASVGKNPQSLREEYEAQAVDALKLDLMLSKIALEEKVIVDEKEISSAIAASEATDKALVGKLDNPEQRAIVRHILTKRETLKKLASL